MCYSALVRADLKHLETRFGATVNAERFSVFAEACARDPKTYHPITGRTFPDTAYAPVLYLNDGKLVIEPMRYGVYLSGRVWGWWAKHVEDVKRKGEKVGGKPTDYNARRDNLTSWYWETAYRKHHGFVVLDGFYENVVVRDLVKAGVISITEVQAFFNAKAEARKESILAKGKKYKPTPTEQKPTLDRNIEILFQTETPQELLVPVIFNEKVLEDGYRDKGFAIVTDEPLPEVAAAGHDRSPVMLLWEDIDQWLRFDGKTPEQLDAILAQSRKVIFEYGIAEAA